MITSKKKFKNKNSWVWKFLKHISVDWILMIKDYFSLLISGCKELKNAPFNCFLSPTIYMLFFMLILFGLALPFLVIGLSLSALIIVLVIFIVYSMMLIFYVHLGCALYVYLHVMLLITVFPMPEPREKISTFLFTDSNLDVNFRYGIAIAFTLIGLVNLALTPTQQSFEFIYIKKILINSILGVSTLFSFLELFEEIQFFNNNINSMADLSLIMFMLAYTLKDLLGILCFLIMWVGSICKKHFVFPLHNSMSYWSLAFLDMLAYKYIVDSQLISR